MFVSSHCPWLSMVGVLSCVCISRVSWFSIVFDSRFRLTLGPLLLLLCPKPSPRHLRSVVWGLILVGRKNKRLDFWLRLDLIFGTPPVNKLGRGWAVLAVNLDRDVIKRMDMYLNVYECLSLKTEKGSWIFIGNTSHKAGTSNMLGGYDFMLWRIRD